MRDRLRARGVRVWLGSALAVLAIAPASVLADPPSPSPSPRAVAIARQLTASNTDQGQADPWSRMDSLIVTFVQKPLQITDPSQAAKVEGIVRGELSAFAIDASDASATALAQTLSEQDMEGYLAFLASPSGQAFNKANQEYRRDFVQAARSGERPNNDPVASGPKLELINRLLTAQGYVRSDGSVTHFENNSSSGLSGLGAGIARSVYSRKLTDGQVRDALAFVEGPVGRDLVAGQAPYQSLRKKLVMEALNRHLDKIEAEVCEADTCTAAQRSGLAAMIGQMKALSSNLAVGGQ